MLLLQGCALLPVAAIGGALLEAGGGALVKTGTEYTASGLAIRTFAIPAGDVRAATLTTFDRTQVAVVADEVSKKGIITLTGEAPHRKIRVRLIPLTPTLTQMELRVKRNILASDKATASELLAETERTLAENPAFAVRLEDVSNRCTLVASASRPVVPCTVSTEPRVGDSTSARSNGKPCERALPERAPSRSRRRCR
ncbi:MAG TPA: hypothetical protein VGK30_08380 [Candidatus Binatia bacterium]|jgi:hypothetical protein